MNVATTFRGLSDQEAASAAALLEKGDQRLDRLLEPATPIRAVVEGAPEHRVMLSVQIDGVEFSAHGSNHDLTASVSEAIDRLRTQLVRHREKREALRHRAATA